MNWTSAAANTPLGAVYDNSATCLPDGTVLFIGGARYDNKGAVNTVITLDPNPTNPTWRQMTPMPPPLMEHTATLLDDGTVLVVGGRHDWQFNCLATVSRYDFKSWHQEPNMTWPRAKHTATNLPTGEVMIAGGYSSNQNDTPKDCEIYVPTVK
jgi:N-acetylneuraminic acid mutarotase